MPGKKSEEKFIPVLDYDQDFQCKKCDEKKSDDPGIEVFWSSGGSCNVNGTTVELPDDFEYMRAKCRRCGHQWISQTSDADDRAEAEKERMDKLQEEKRSQKDTLRLARAK